MKSIYTTFINFTFTLAILLTISQFQNLQAQGCVALRNMNCTMGQSFDDNEALTNRWQVSLNSRYFKSYKHFVGTEEQKHRVEQGSQVINNTFSFDFGLSYQLNRRLNITAVVPIIFNDRSSLYEHYGNSIAANPEQKRFHTESNGLGDVRLSASYTLFNPQKAKKANLALGLGIKLPTGKANVEDDFHKLDAEGNDYLLHKIVDQSIQLGDKGLGISAELQGFVMFSSKLSLYYNGYYLFNPRNTNNTYRGGNDPITAYFSVADQYSTRMGLSYSALQNQKLQFSLGARFEGVTSRDVIGGSDGFRRPGYIFSVEPGVSYRYDTWQFGLNVPVALIRNRTKSVSDMADPTGKKHGDAAFADYLVNLSIGFRFGK